MIGTTIGHYRIEEKLGEGGMGVVYKAQDTKLDRLVALKFLPEHVSASSADLERFTQEAKAAAGLNHPNICTIYGIEESDEKSFIVMEFVEGKMLEEVKSTLSVKQSIDIGVQIAEGLAAAHEKGIVHRDIKPENIMIRKDGRVLIMDFGLAKLRGASRLTKEGSTVGTAGYMSPEQVQGQDTDHRSDIFSLGVILYEMFTGQLPFKGIHETAVSYEIVNVDSPPMSAVKTEIPPELDAIVLDCLEKDPRERTQAASQVALELKRYGRESSRQRASRITAARPVASSSSSSSVQTPSEDELDVVTGRNWIFIGLTALAAIIIGFGLAYVMFARSAPPATIQSSIESPDELRFDTNFGGSTVISPDGTTLAFVGVDSSGNGQLCLRSLATRVTTRLAGTNGALYPFWSADSRSLGFFAGGKLKRVDVSGNPPLDIADAPNGRGGAWNKNGIIVFTPEIGEKDFYQVPASGGVPSRVTHHDSSKAPRFPFFLPDGKHFLYVRMRLGAGGSPLRDDYEAYVGSLDGDSMKLPLQGISNMFYASGHVLYLRQSTLIAQAFDANSFELSGDPAPVDKNINFWPARAKGDFSVSQTGILVYGTSAEKTTGELAWADREGRLTPILQANPVYLASLSPDGGRIAFDELAVDQNNLDIWIYDIQRGTKTRFTFDFAFDQIPIWTPDGSGVVFSSSRGANYSVYVKQADGAKEEELIARKEGNSELATSMSPDGRYVLLTELSPTWNLMYADLKGDKSVVSVVSTEFIEGIGSFSPDGRWVAYQSNESGRNEIYVLPFRREGGKYQVSTNGGQGPRWSKSGEIFFTSGTQLMAVKPDLSGSSPHFPVPKPLFAVGGETGIEFRDATRDGKKFLVSRSGGGRVKNSFSIIANWEGLVEKE